MAVHYAGQYAERSQPTLPVRGATNAQYMLAKVYLISTLAPAWGATGSAIEYNIKPQQFQPTLPARGATPRSAEKMRDRS